MKNLKTILIPVGLFAIIGIGYAFAKPLDKDGDKKCQIKIIKNINGVETVVDSTFDCPEDMSWVQTFHDEMDGDSIHKMIKIMMVDGDSGEFNFNFDTNENLVSGHKMKMIINGKEMEIEMEKLQEHLKNLHQQLGDLHDENKAIEVVMENNEDGKEPHSIKIIKSIDDEGNITMKKIVDGKEVKIKDNDLQKMHGNHKMMFVSEEGDVTTMDGNEAMTIDVKVEMENGKESKHIVIISKISAENKNEMAKKIPAIKKDLDKKELAISNLKFSPNPNEGKFDVSFKLTEKTPVGVKIFDMQGKEVYNERINDFSGEYNNNLDITSSGEGIYILQITQNEKVSTSKIVIK